MGAGEASGRRDPGGAPRRRRFLLRLTLAGVLVLAGVAGWVDTYGQVERARPADAIVVLGARVTEHGVPGDSLHARALHAAALYRRGTAKNILFTGGVGEHSPGEAAAAAALARSLDVPSGDLVLDERSTSTHENAVYAAEICRARGWRSVVVVSDPYHLRRAKREFTRAGLETYTSPARDCARNRKLHRRAYWALREVLLLGRDVLSGR